MSWTKTRSLIARATKENPEADLTELYRQFKAERLEYIIRERMAEGPDLTPKQRRTLAALFREAKSA